MIAWLAPAALTGLLLIAGPVVVHMLLRRNARRVIFPTTRFLVATKAAAVRFRSPSDAGLLLLRIAIVTAAVLACAQPVLLAGWRTAQWNKRTARAVVLDTSRSVPVPPDAARLAAAQMDAFAAARFEGDDVADAVTRASAWLAAAPPARRELVIVSDFQRGAIDAHALSVVPAGVGLRFIRAGTQPVSRSVTLPQVSGWLGGEWQPAVTLSGNTTDAVWTRIGASTVSWLSVEAAPADGDAAARALAAAVSFGVAPGDDSRRATVAFAGAPPDRGAGEVQTPWILRVAAALRASELLRESGAEVSAFERAGGLLVRANVAAGSAAAPAVVRAVAAAMRPPEIADRELETATLSDADLNAWRREPAPISSATPIGVGDGFESRWLWAAALVLLGIETWLRRKPTRRSQDVAEARADAA